jgi:hypothetical protein
VIAQLVDKNLDLKPVPKLKLSMRDEVATRSTPFSTGFDGQVKAQLPCGSYALKTGEPIEFEGKRFSWDIKVKLVQGNPNDLELSVDNAATEKVVPQVSAVTGRVTDDLAVSFKKYEPSVVTVWSELGHGTGFFIEV